MTTASKQKPRFSVETRERKSKYESDCDRYYVITDRLQRGFECARFHVSYPLAEQFSNLYCAVLNRIHKPIEYGRF